MSSSDWEQQAQYYASDAAAAWDKCEERRLEAEALRGLLNEAVGALRVLVANIEHAWPSLATLGPLVDARAVIAKAEGRQP